VPLFLFRYLVGPLVRVVGTRGLVLAIGRPVDAADSMGQSAPELPAETLVSAIDNARRGVVTHITIKGERVAAIVSESTLAMSQLLAALLTSEMAASALPAVLSAAFPWASSLPDTDTHLKAFARELREAVVAESPERIRRVLDDWQAVAEVRAGARST
jgi:hypothetical protein